MDKWYRVRDVAEVMNCSEDTARARMGEMPGVVNVGSEKRRQLMVPEYGIEDWMRNHRITTPLRATTTGSGSGSTSTCS